MSDEANDEVVRVFAGSLVEAEIYQNVLNEAGIENRLVGAALTAGFGSAIPGSVELWVHRRDAEKATAAIRRYDENPKEPPPRFPPPVSDPKPPRPPA